MKQILWFIEGVKITVLMKVSIDNSIMNSN